MRNRRFCTKKTNYFLFGSGLFIVLLQLIPHILLGEGTVIPYHDQLDGEMLSYIFQAKYLFSADVIPEFMGGTAKTALTPPAPAFVLLFCVLKPFAAYTVMFFLELLTAYAGMYLLAKEVNAGAFLSVVLACVFCYLPFLPLYGLSQFGIPLLLWFYLRLKKQKNYTWAFLYCAIYAFCSSLVLVGFGILLLLAVELVSHALRHKKTFPVLFTIFFEMIFIYCLENYRLITQMLGIGKEGEVISHKSEYAPAADNFFSSLSTMFFQGSSHSEDYHFYLLIACVIGLLICLTTGRGLLQKKRWLPLGKVYGYMAAMILLAAFWQSSASASLKQHIGFLSGLAVWRVMWIVSSLWFLSAAMLIGMLRTILLQEQGKKRMFALAATGIFPIMLGIMGIKCLWNGTYKANVCRIIGREYSSISFEEYYANGVMEQIQEYLYETSGEQPGDYRVLSLGIDPAAAYYHGFYCLDGYSNNYSVEYKHQFRKIIAPELAKSEYLRTYFDDWGNRCYLWCAQIPGYFNFEKYTSYFWNYEIDTKAAKELGAKYILSAVYLTNAEELGLKRIREEAFETPESYYAIYLYGIE